MVQRLAAFLLLASVSLAQSANPRLEEIVQCYVSNHQFMGSVLVAKSEGVVLDRGYGFANLEWNIPNSPTTKFRLGSVTKQFTAACILLLEQRGKLKIEDPVSEAESTTPEKLVDRFRNKPLEFEPGSKWKYSNSGYVLLGYLITKVSGETYQKFLQDNVFTRLGMKDSGYDSNSAIVPHRASGYSPSKDGIINAGFINMTIRFVVPRK